MLERCESRTSTLHAGGRNFAKDTKDSASTALLIIGTRTPCAPVSGALFTNDADGPRIRTMGEDPALATTLTMSCMSESPIPRAPDL